MACAITIEHDRHTDMAFVILCEPEPGATIDTIPIGEFVGFPGLITARVSYDRETLYGLNIENFTLFKRKLFWQHHMFSLQKAIQLIVCAVKAGITIEHKRPAYA
ncbi:MAG TPA: hypothetical protein VFQ00_10790 [Terriglobales bacterium]|nr:hypothetical protein [Terriglobales bacterium]